jgi:drug/metabolite transporter (DMT)-like permease
VVFVGLASLGLRYMPWRKAVMVSALVATLYLLPLYILTRGISVVGENVQPRYLVPLVVVLGGLLLLGISARSLRPGPWHVIPAIVLLAGANSIALYTNLRRYVTGFDVEQLSLGTGAEWWWTGLPIGPTGVWVFGSLAFTGLVVVLGIAWLRNDRERSSPLDDLDPHSAIDRASGI